MKEKKEPGKIIKTTAKESYDLQKKLDKKEKVEVPEGLKQKFKSSEGKLVTIESCLIGTEWWISKGRIKRTILIHDGVKRIADAAGVSKDVQYTILTQPTAYNNYQYTIQARICKDKECVTEIGEANRNNLGGKGRNNPANMCQKRAYDRCVFRLLGITGLLSEEELSDEDEEETKMDGLSHEERKEIAPFLNKLLLAKTNENLNDFNKMMQQRAITLTPILKDTQLSYLRKMYQKKVAELQGVEF